MEIIKSNIRLIHLIILDNLKIYDSNVYEIDLLLISGKLDIVESKVNEILYANGMEVEIKKSAIENIKYMLSNYFFSCEDSEIKKVIIFF